MINAIRKVIRFCGHSCTRLTGILLISLGLLSFQSASGQEGRFYLGAGGGYSDLGFDSGDITSAAAAAGVTGTTTSVDDNDIGWKLFGGYQFTRNWGLEVFYADLGDGSASFTATAPFAGTLNISTDASGFGAAATGTYPINNQFGVHAKLGVFRWDVDAQAAAVVAGVTATASADDTGTDLMFGVGASYNFNQNSSVRIEWERFNDVGDDLDVDLFSGSFLYRF